MAILPSLSSCQQLRVSLPSSVWHPYPKVEFGTAALGGSNVSHNFSKWPSSMLSMQNSHYNYRKRFAGLCEGYRLPSPSINDEAESFLLRVINMNFLERLNLAWKIVFPSSTQKRSSNAKVAKQRLKMILFSDRCVVSDEAKRKIVSNIVRVLSEFVEIESQDKVELSVTADTDLGTVYSVTVPVRRVKQEYRDAEEAGCITNIVYKDRGESSGSVDVLFDFFVPDKSR